jgi:hypothetical protein
MKLNLKIKIIGLALIALTACKKETAPHIDVLQPGTNNSGTASGADLKAFFNSNLANAEQSFTIDAVNPSLITGNQGTTIQFNPNSFETMSGQNVVGNVQIKLLEIFSKEQMILLNKPTMANNPAGGLAPLISGGETRITAIQNGQTLRLKPGMDYALSVPAPNGVEPNMGLFYGENGNDTLIWTLADSANFNMQGNNYFPFPTALSWINCDYFYNNPNPKTTVQVQMPTGLNGTNSAIFISFDGLNSLAQLYNFSGGVFTSSPNYQLPIGLPVHFIALAIINGNPHASIVSSTITSNHLEIMPTLTQMTTAQLSTALANLP